MTDLKTSLGKLNFKKNGRLFGFGTSPQADWKIIFITTLILSTLVIGVSAFIFIKIDKGEIFVVEKSGTEGSRTLNLSLLRETLTYYQNKLAEFERIKSTKPSAVDPSL